MNKIEEIFKSWGIMLNPNQQQSALAGKRAEICNSCEHRKEMGICGLCGCFLSAKIYSPEQSACPDGRWNKIDKGE